MDQDYLQHLTEEELSWLNQFMDEWLHSNFPKKRKKLMRKKKDRLDAYGRNNSRNRDLYTILRTRGWINGATDNELAKLVSANPEEALIEAIDAITASDDKDNL